ncbi:hypothetical protein CFP56_018742 [Quercus suber]|uniref:Uncharacterized protein n=1 Tax=Quercus suber TaxID=58331 RepID=A0AAW0KL70_QUESU
MHHATIEKSAAVLEDNSVSTKVIKSPKHLKLLSYLKHWSPLMINLPSSHHRITTSTVGQPHLFKPEWTSTPSLGFIVGIESLVQASSSEPIILPCCSTKHQNECPRCLLRKKKNLSVSPFSLCFHAHREGQTVESEKSVQAHELKLSNSIAL